MRVWEMLVGPVMDLPLYWPIVVQGAMVSVTLGLLGCYLVVRGMSLLGDALSHSVLPGIVIGFLIGGTLHSPWILIGATAMGVLASMLVAGVHRGTRVKEDASLGIVFTTLFALGVVMINLYSQRADLDPGCVLYGNIEQVIVERGSMWPTLGILIVVVLTLIVFRRQLLVCTFDPMLAVSLGISERAVHYLLMTLLALAIVGSFESVGAILAVALLIMPGATARYWTDRMTPMLLVAAAHGVVSTVLGYWLSHPSVMNTSAGGAIAVSGFVLFLGSWLLAPGHGIIPRGIARKALRDRVGLENLLKEVAERGGSTRLAELAAENSPSGPFRERIIRAAERQGLLARAVDRLELTEAGARRAQKVARAHELWEEYLRRQMGVLPDHVHDAAEWIEHHLRETELAELEGELK